MAGIQRCFYYLLLTSLVLFAIGCDSKSSGQSSAQSQSEQSQSSSVSSFEASTPSAAWMPSGVVDTLPQLSIRTEGLSTITSKDEYIVADYELRDSEFNIQSGQLKIRGRGNSTWNWPKKPYKIKLEDPTSLLGMTASKHWVLLANFSDKTLIRNDLAFTLSRAMEMEYTVADRYIDLYVNDQYEGVYQLTEQIRLAKSRLNFPELDAGESDPDIVTGSYLLEVDFRMSTDLCNFPEASLYFSNCVDGINVERAVAACYDPVSEMSPICVKDPDEMLSDEREAQRSYIQQYLNDLEGALLGPQFSDPELGYRTYLDVDSAIDYFIINELFKNVDGTEASFFLYKKRLGKVYFGPIWDFDLAMGNASYNGVDNPQGWHIRNAAWYTRMFEDNQFTDQLKSRWHQLKEEGTFNQILAYIPARAHWLETTQQDNFERWDTIDGISIFAWRTWFNEQLLMPGSYEGEVEKLYQWQKERLEWMDTQINAL